MAKKAHSPEKGTGDWWDRNGMGGSIAQMLDSSPGGIEGALERVRAAKAAGVEPSAAIAVGEKEAFPAPKSRPS